MRKSFSRTKSLSHISLGKNVKVLKRHLRISEIMQSGFEQQIKNELLSKIEALEKNYAVIKDILSGVNYQLSEVKENLQSFKDNLSGVISLVQVLSQIKTSETRTSQQISVNIDSLISQIDLALLFLELSPQQNPSSIIQMSLYLSNIKIEEVMSFISILKKVI